jgi:hypothetical protein
MAACLDPIVKNVLIIINAQGQELRYEYESEERAEQDLWYIENTFERMLPRSSL